MEEKYTFIIKRYCPTEELFKGEMTFTEAHKFMDEHATPERRVGYIVFNEWLGKWEDFKDAYHGGRKVYDHKGQLYILKPNYAGMDLPEMQQWHLCFIDEAGENRFLQSFATKEKANARCQFLQGCANIMYDGVKYVVKPSDIQEL